MINTGHKTVISIKNTEFISNYVKTKSVLYINLESCPDYDINLQDLIFDSNAAESSALVSIIYSKTEVIYPISAWYREELMSISMQNLMFIGNYVMLQGILELKNVTNVIMYNSTFDSNGISLVDLNSLLVEK